MNLRSIGARVGIGVSAALLVMAAAIIGYSSYTRYYSEIDHARKESIAVAEAHASGIRAEIEVALDSARTLAEVLGSSDAGEQQTFTRLQVEEMLAEVVRNHSGFLGVYTLWEPNAFDGKDGEFAGAAGHDETGRFIPYAVRNNDGSVMIDPLVDYENHEKGSTGVRKGEYYLCSKESGKECVVNPYPYEINGKDVLLTSLVAPIKKNGRFLGIAGIDIALETLQTRVDEAGLFKGTGTMTIVSNNGRIVSTTGNPGLAGKMFSSLRDEEGEADLFEKALLSGKGDEVLGEELAGAAAIEIGETETPWVVSVLAPESVVTAEARSAVFAVIGIGVVIALLALLAINFIVVRWVNRQLSGIVQELSEGSEQVASAAAQVASAGQSLASGASEQAASNQETSASSLEVKSMADRNLEVSNTIVGEMEKSNTIVASANQSLEEMLASMKGISDSSEQISKIIKVIDEIAFQTNILALNAAVEAARAGEAGMGFAVVADEVRNLAQRSAQAARDTAELIEESIERTTAGSGKLDQVAEAMNGITNSAGHLRALAREIGKSSEEQSNGVEQIVTAIGQMESVTQRVAASAEESASASEELTAQAASVDAVVSRLQELVTGAGRARNLSRLPMNDEFNAD